MGVERRRHEGFASRFLDNERTLTVALPPGYAHEHDRRYPVLYLHDGQNLFDPAEAAFGMSWQADATAARLTLAGRIPPLLLVGIANTPARMEEYTHHRDGRQKAGGQGARYARFVLDEVKPFIDRQYRTLPDRAHTALAGSSLGGLVSLYMARDYSERFAQCAALSPSLWWARGRALADLSADPSWMKRMRFWVDMGTREGNRRAVVPPGILNTRKLIEHFDAAGLAPGWDYYYQEVTGGEHNENAWAARFDKVLLYLFGHLRSRGQND